MSMKNSNDTMGNRTRGLPTCSAVPQQTALTRVPLMDNFTIFWYPTFEVLTGVLMKNNFTIFWYPTFEVLTEVLMKNNFTIFWYPTFEVSYRGVDEE